MTPSDRVAGLAIEDTGVDGHPFVWAHGLTSSRSVEDATGLFPWSAIEGLRVIRYDARGHGASAGPDDPAAYEWPALAADMVAVLDAAGLSRASIGGASMGCASALGAALLAPDRVARLVLVAPPTAWATRPAQRRSYEDAARLVERGGPGALIEAGRTERPPAVLGDAGESARRAGLAQVQAMDPNVLAAVLRGAAASDLPPPDTLAAITQPALVLAWVDDSGHPLSTAEVLAAALPDAELHVATDVAAIRRWPQAIGSFLTAG